MSREIRIGATEPISDATAFAVSRDSAGILIGVRDNAAPQFSVSRDAGGLLLSARPSAPPPPPPPPTAYVASGYVLGTGATAVFNLQILYWNIFLRTLWGSVVTAPITTSLTDWRRIYVTAPIPENAVYVSMVITCPMESPAGAYWTAMQMEGGTVASAYRVGGANLALNPEFTPDLSYWTPLYAGVFSRATSLPSAPLPGVTTALEYVSDGWDSSVWYEVTHQAIALPTS